MKYKKGITQAMKKVLLKVNRGTATYKEIETLNEELTLINELEVY